MKNIVLILLFAVSGNFSGYSQVTNDSIIGKPVPGLVLKTVDGNTLNLSDLKGKVIVINLYYKGCGHCMDEIPLLNKMAEKYKDNDNIIILAISSRDDSLMTRKFQKQYNVKYPLVHSKFPAKGKDWQSKTNSKMIKDNFGVTGYPTNIIVDKNGTITYFRVGYDRKKPKYNEEFINAIEAVSAN